MKQVKHLRLGEKYYSPSPIHRKMYVRLTWEGSEFDCVRLTRGLVYSTPTAAVKRAAEMLSH